MATIDALDSGDVSKVSVGVLIALVVVGILVFLAISALVARVIVFLVVVGLALLVWQQRGAVQDRINNCHVNTSFVGIKVQAPDDVTKRCQQLRK